jgi:hypothetical protein
MLPKVRNYLSEAVGLAWETRGSREALGVWLNSTQGLCTLCCTDIILGWCVMRSSGGLLVSLVVFFVFVGAWIHGCFHASLGSNHHRTSAWDLFSLCFLSCMRSWTELGSTWVRPNYLCLAEPKFPQFGLNFGLLHPCTKYSTKLIEHY